MYMDHIRTNQGDQLGPWCDILTDIGRFVLHYTIEGSFDHGRIKVSTGGALVESKNVENPVYTPNELFTQGE